MMGEQVNIEQLYHKSWFKPSALWTLLFFLYVPIGLCLFIIRTFILIQFVLLGYLLSPSKLREKCMRVMGAVLGVSVSTEGEKNLGAGKVYVANHVTGCDHFAIHLITNAVMPKKEKTSLLSRVFGVVELAFETLTKEQIEGSDNQYVIFPEGESTNGEIGVLSFSSGEIPQGVVIQPVAIKVNRVFLNASCVKGSPLQELLIMLFCPNTNYSLKFLQSDTIDPEGNWKTKVQSDIANSLGLVTTKLNASDKAEFVKRLLFKPPSLASMTREVQKRLAPQTISVELIMSTLQRTGSIEATLESLRQSGSINPASSTFSKSATQRMTSFQERKRMMIANARKKYIEKHNLNIPV